MLSRAYRFHGYNSLTTLYRHGKTVRSQVLSLKFAQNERRRRYRCAVVVSRKVNKSAIVRNRIRRRIYAIVEELAQNISQPYDIAVIVYDDQVASMSPKELNNLINRLFHEAKILSITPTKPPPRDIIKEKGI